MTSAEDKKRDQQIDKLIETQNKFITNISSFIKSSKNTEDNTQKKDRFLVKKDLTEELMKKENLILDKILKVDIETLNETKKKKSGLLTGLGALLGLGGLAGYLLTGKKEFLFDIIKALTKYLPTKILLKPFDWLIQKGIPSAIKGMAKLLPKITEPFSKLFSKITEPLLKSAKSFIEPILNSITKPLNSVFKFAKNIGEFLKPITNIFGKVAEKAGGKMLGNTAKTLLKKIPGVGTILGIFFGIERFKNGDIIGGIGEIASGVASMFPGVGTAISLVIDGLLLMKDFGVFGKAEEADPKKKHTDIRDIPVIGQIVKSFDAINNFVKDPFESTKELAKMANMFVPGLGDALYSSVDWIESLKDSKIGKSVKNLVGKLKPKDLLVNNNAEVNTPAKNENYYKRADYGVDTANLNKEMFGKFEKMAKEYNLLTKDVLQVNSGYRSFSDQMKLWSDKQAGLMGSTPVARPGYSKHNYGNAIDIQSAQVQKLKELGLLDKYGFVQPYSSKDPQHIEMARVRQDSANNNNVRRIDNELFGKETNYVLKLADESINKLAVKIAEENKINATKITQKQVIAVNARK